MRMDSSRLMPSPSQRAEEILRVKLGSKASKAASRITAEGVVAVQISADGKTGAIVEMNCETDFVAKNEDFLALAAGIAQLVLDKAPADVAAVSALHLNLDEALPRAGYRSLLDIAARTGCNYFCINVRITICNECGQGIVCCCCLLRVLC